MASTLPTHYRPRVLRPSINVSPYTSATVVPRTVSTCIHPQRSCLERFLRVSFWGSAPCSQFIYGLLNCVNRIWWNTNLGKRPLIKKEVLELPVIGLEHEISKVSLQDVIHCPSKRLYWYLSFSPARN